MASPPFVLNTAVPGDDDTVSQYPSVDRADKGIIQSWLLTDHNVNGTHTQSTHVQVGTLLSDGITTTVTPTPASGNTAIFRDTDGGMKMIKGDDSTVEWLPIPPGAVIDYAGSTAPTNWLLCYGQAISRTTYARLFTAISTTYGAGDGSTTFNVPDLRGQVVAGLDNMGGTAKNFIGTVVTDNGTISGTTIGSYGGSATHVQTAAEMHQHTHIDNGHTHTIPGYVGGTETCNITQTGSLCVSSFPSPGTSTNSGFASLQNTGSSSAMSLLQPTAMLNKIIHI